MPIVTYTGTAPMLAKMIEGAARGVALCAEDLVGRAQEQAPVDTGALRGGIHVEGIQVSGNSVEAKVSTGGESNEYAIFQHEGTSRGVPATKFLEFPLLMNRDLYLQIIANNAKL